MSNMSFAQVAEAISRARNGGFTIQSGDRAVTLPVKSIEVLDSNSSVALAVSKTDRCIIGVLPSADGKVYGVFVDREAYVRYMEDQRVITANANRVNHTEGNAVTGGEYSLGDPADDPDLLEWPLMHISEGFVATNSTSRAITHFRGTTADSLHYAYQAQYTKSGTPFMESGGYLATFTSVAPPFGGAFLISNADWEELVHFVVIEQSRNMELSGQTSFSFTYNPSYSTGGLTFFTFGIYSSTLGSTRANASLLCELYTPGQDNQIIKPGLAKLRPGMTLAFSILEAPINVAQGGTVKVRIPPSHDPMIRHWLRAVRAVYLKEASAAVALRAYRELLPRLA